MIRLKLPLDKKERASLKAGQKVFITGKLYTARDMAHKRLIGMIASKRPLPIPLEDETIYYCGPTPPPPGKPTGSCGPTTSSRMDPFTKALLKKGLGSVIGKGARSDDIRRAFKKSGSVYFIATGGIGALLSKKVKRMGVAAFRDLGTEAIHELWVEDFPAIVGIDTKGRDVYEK
jgi:fumarate hydratase subunit beta